MKKIVLVLATLSLILVGCSNKSAVKVDLKAIAEEIKTLEATKDIGFLEADDTILQVFNVNVDQVESYMILKPFIAQIAFEVLMFEAKDGKLADIKANVKTYIDGQIAGGAFYPANIEAYEKHTVFENGNYYFVIVGDTDNAILSVIEKAFK